MLLSLILIIICESLNRLLLLFLNHIPTGHAIEVELKTGKVLLLFYPAGLFPAILGKGPMAKIGKMIDLTSKLGEINNIEHNKGSKIYLQNQVILYCIMSSIPLQEFKYHSDMGHCFS